MAQAKISSTPILDASGVAELFATDLSVLETLGPCYRLTFTVAQSGYSGEPELAPVIKVVMSAEAVQQMLLNLPLLMRNLPDHSKPNHENRAHLN